MDIFSLRIINRNKKLYLDYHELIHGNVYTIHSMDYVDWSWRPGDKVVYYKDGNAGRHPADRVLVKIGTNSAWNPVSVMVKYNIVLVDDEIPF